MSTAPAAVAMSAAPASEDLFPAAAPAEARGLARDGVRLLVSHSRGGGLAHARLRDLPRFLRRGDLVVVNTSAVLPASLPARDDSGTALRVHVSTELAAGRWLVEVRLPHSDASLPFPGALAGQRLTLPEGGSVRLVKPFGAGPGPGGARSGTRLWHADLVVPGSVQGFLARHGRPIRYGAKLQPWPLAAYQTVFASEPGSAESPSAGRGFTRSLVGRLRRRGVHLARLVLHTGVSSQESGEMPYPERYRVPASTALAVEETRARRGRVIAVGTTVTRALETVALPDGRIRAGRGWTDLVVTPERGVQVVDGLLTGWHEPSASHVHLLEAVAGAEALTRAYAAAAAAGYHGHEFGDAALFLP